MKWIAIAIAAAISGPSAMAEGRPSSAVKTDDICSERPDLCGEDARRPQAKAKKVRSVATTQTRCRKKGEAYSLDDASLPLCGTRKTAPKKRADAEESFDELLGGMNEESTSPNSRREPAAAAESNGRSPRRISFTSYLNSNANHPSISGRFGGRQEAFIVPIRPATLTVPGSSSSSPVGDGAADGQSMKDYPAAPPVAPPGSTTPTPPPPSGNQNQ